MIKRLFFIVLVFVSMSIMASPNSSSPESISLDIAKRCNKIEIVNFNPLKTVKVDAQEITNIVSFMKNNRYVPFENDTELARISYMDNNEILAEALLCYSSENNVYFLAFNAELIPIYSVISKKNADYLIALINKK